jgi:glycosyltransferase involved in cell wall biosynthesis
MATNFGMTGVETFIVELARAQLRAGLSPAITLEVEGREEAARAARAIGVTVHDFPRRADFMDQVPRKLGTALLRARRVQELRRLLDGVDVLHMHSVGIVGLDAFSAALLARKPVVVTHHTTLSYASSRSALRDVTFWLEKRAAGCIVMPYEAAAAEMVQGGMAADRVRVVPFCVDHTRFRERTKPPHPGELRLLMPARVIEGQGPRELLAAMETLAPRHPGLRLVIAGDGPARGEIAAAVERKGLRPFVEMRGHVPHAEMPALFRECHVVVLPSYMPGETFPLSLLEGMAMGLPSIGSRWFGIPDIIEDGRTGFVVPPRDAQALAAAIERYLRDPHALAEAGDRAIRRVRERFTASAVADAYSDLYARARIP